MNHCYNLRLHAELAEFDGYPDEVAQLRSAADEIERLQTMLDPLPRLACGTPPYPGMAVWKVHNDGSAVCGPWQVLGIREHGCFVEQKPGVRMLRSFSDLYGTRAAAEKARE